MHVMYFSERPYHPVPEEVLLRNGYWGVPNTYYDPAVASRLYNEYLDEDVFAEKMGFDGIMLNEHHGLILCMGSVVDVEASILARITEKVRIVLLGNPLPVVGNPLRLAEELAEIDLISKGRLVAGWVRGGGTEQFANNTNPSYNREYFNEAHDLIVKAWTTPGPFRWEGKHFNYRFVNPWALPLQKPHPPMWIPGLVSPETVQWCAKHRYPYVALATYLEPTVELWNLYAEAAAQEGYQAGPENFGYLQKVYVAETEEKAQELGKQDLYGGGMYTAIRPEWLFPSGYNSKAATQRLARQFTDPKGRTQLFTGYEGQSIEEAKAAVYGLYPHAQESYQLIRGTPKTVIPKLRKIMEVLRPGIFGLWQNDGPIGHPERMNNIRLLGEEVIPAMREIAKELGLESPLERQPGSRPLPATGQWDPVAQSEALAAL